MRSVEDVVRASEKTAGDIAKMGIQAQNRAWEADVELRRGLITFNGAALVATISALTSNLPAPAVAASAQLFFVGLLLAITSWIFGEFGPANLTLTKDAAEKLQPVVTLAQSDMTGARSLLLDQKLQDAADTLHGYRVGQSILSTIVLVSAVGALTFFIWGIVILVDALPGTNGPFPPFLIP